METIIFIIAWILTGLVALHLVVTEQERFIAEINNSDKITEDDESYKAAIEEASDEMAEAGFEICKRNHLIVLLVNIVGIAIWPVLVPIALYRIIQAKKGNMVL